MAEAIAADREVELSIRSFRSVFDFERRIYRIDTIRLNPGGVPLRGVIYALCSLAALLLAERIPLIGALVRLVPWYVRYLLLPGLAAATMALLRIEGRSFHLALAALLAYALQPRALASLRRCPPLRTGARYRPPDLELICDGSEAEIRRIRYRGPGAVRISSPHRLAAAGAAGAAGSSLHLLPGAPASAAAPRRAGSSGRSVARVLEISAGTRLRCGSSSRGGGWGAIEALGARRRPGGRRPPH